MRPESGAAPSVRAIISTVATVRSSIALSPVREAFQTKVFAIRSHPWFGGQRLSETIARWETIENPTILSYDGIPG